MEKLKNLSFFFIPYAALCAGIYHLTYWDFFDLNGLQIVSLTDLIKPTIKPILDAATPIIISLLFMFFDPVPSFNLANNSQAKINIKKIVIFIIFILLIFQQLYTNDFKGFILVITCIVSIYYSHKLTFIHPNSRYPVMVMLLFFPLNSWRVGVESAKEIQSNTQYQYIIFQGEKLKYLGSNEKYLICSDVNNFRIEFIELESLGNYTLHHYCKPKEKK